jgi:hypothetical protein
MGKLIIFSGVGTTPSVNKSKIYFTSLILVVLLTPFIMAQTPAEPIQPTVEYTIEICWGTLTSTSTWSPLAADIGIVNESADGIHHYLSKLGPQLWEAPISFDPLIPQKIIISFNMTKDMIPKDGFNFHFYRIRIVKTTSNQVTNEGIVDNTVIVIMSQASEWVVIYEEKVVGKPKLR